MVIFIRQLSIFIYLIKTCLSIPYRISPLSIPTLYIICSPQLFISFFLMYLLFQDLLKSINPKSEGLQMLQDWHICNCAVMMKFFENINFQEKIQFIFTIQDLIYGRKQTQFRLDVFKIIFVNFKGTCLFFNNSSNIMFIQFLQYTPDWNY